MDLGLRGKVSIITGGSTGIGRAIALGLAAEGAAVAFCARREGPLRETEAVLRSTGAHVYAACCDVADPASLERFLNAAKSHFGQVHLLVNNASGFGMTDDDEGWSKNLDVDVLGSVRATRQVAPWIAEAGGGSILFISSIAGLEYLGSAGPYAAAKAALISYAKTCAMDLAPRNIRVNTIAPGSIEFPGGNWEQARLSKAPRYEIVRQSIPFKRLGVPEDVADCAVYLLSNRARWITGECICVDGGQHKGL